MRGRVGTLVTWALTVAVAVWALPRLLPHLTALAGVRTDGAPFRLVGATLTGDTVDTSRLRGQVILVNVWATWCLPCRVEMPLLEGTWQRHRAAGLVVVGASIDRGDPNVVRQYVIQRGVSYPMTIVDGAARAALGGLQGVPTSILIGRDGRVRHRVIGPIGPLTLEPAIRRALAEPVPASR